MRLVKKYPIISMVHHTVFSYPSPSNLNYLWNFGSLALICLGIQIVSGIFLAMHYISYDLISFTSVEHIMRDVNSGWMLRYLHANGASMFFIVVYTHVFRGLYYSSYAPPREILWMVGVLILLIMILTAFMGYVLPWGQMSFWAATVITNLASAIPYGIGNAIVLWLWGGFAVGGATLTRFYSFHYLFPFIIFALSFVHIVLLHENGSNNPLGLGFRTDYVNFGPYYIVKDIFGVCVFLLVYINFAFFYPNYLGHTDNYIMANSLVTPAHIVPEWYFLPFYAILRSVPDKLMGVLLLLGSIFILMLLPFYTKIYVRSTAFKPFFKVGFWFFVVDCVFLGWLGGKAIETPFLELGKAATIFYFVYFLVLLPLFTFIENFVWFPYKKIGALTSKPSAFRIRSWEVKSIETIDCVDSTLLPIIVNVKNLKIQRILPKFNKEFMTEWLSDRSRFVYDSLSRNVLSHPIIYYKKYNCFNNISIKYVNMHILGFLKQFKPQILSLIGDIVDLESIFFLKKIVRKYSYNNPMFIDNNNIENWNVLCTQRLYYLSSMLNNAELKKNIKYFFLGIDLRYDIPLLNIEFRKLKNCLIFLVGPLNYNLNYNFTHLGLSLKKKIIKKYVLNKGEILKKKQYKKKNLIIIGKDFLKLNNQNFNIKVLKKTLNVVVLSDQTSYVNTHEIGVLSKKSKTTEKTKTLYGYTNNIKNINYNIYLLFNLERLKNYAWFKTKKTMLLYQGSFFNNFNSLKKQIFCVFPTSTFFEEKQVFINCFGFLKKTKTCINNKKFLNLKDFLLKMNFYIKNSFLEYSSYYTVFEQHNEYYLEKKLNIILTIFFEFSKKEIIYKKTMKKNKNNFFCRTTLNKNSLYCLLGQKNMLKKKYYV